jgi:excisionase family DNA binding protein
MILVVSEGFGKQTVWRWIREGRLPALRIGKKYRLSREDYLAFLAQHRKRSPDERVLLLSGASLHGSRLCRFRFHSIKRRSSCSAATGTRIS